jgi:hypothetical protein
MHMTLQSFVDPYNRRNNIIQAKWTPQNAYFHRKTNMNDMADLSIEFHSRLTTIDGPTINCVIEERISPHLTKDIEKLILNMVNVVRGVSGYHTNISAMTAYFKLDELGRIWFLYCTKIAIREKGNMFAFPNSPKTLKPRYPSPLFRVTIVDKQIMCREQEKTMFIGGVDTHYKANNDQRTCTICLCRCKVDNPGHGMLCDIPIGLFIKEYEKRSHYFPIRKDLNSPEEPSRKSEASDSQYLEAISKLHPVVVSVFFRLFGEKDAEVILVKQYPNEHFRNTVTMKVCDRCFTECTEHVILPSSEKTALKTRKTFMKRLDEKREQVFLDGIRQDLQKRLTSKQAGQQSDEERKLLENLK